MQDGITALIYASDRGHIAIVEALVEAGADKDVKNSKVRDRQSGGLSGQYSRKRRTRFRVVGEMAFSGLVASLRLHVRSADVHVCTFFSIMTVYFKRSSERLNDILYEI